MIPAPAAVFLAVLGFTVGVAAVAYALITRPGRRRT